MKFGARGGWLLFSLWALVGNAAVPLPPLPPLLAAPADRILADFQRELAQAEGPAMRFAVLEQAFSEVEAAFFQLRKHSFYQISAPQNCPATLARTIDGFQRILTTGRATHLELEHFRALGMRIGMGTPPYENAVGLDRYRDYADLPSGPRSTAVAARLLEVVTAMEAAYFPETAGLPRDAELALPQAKLRLLAIQLTDFVFIERRRWSGN